MRATMPLQFEGERLKWCACALDGLVTVNGQVRRLYFSRCCC